ncbi:MAG: hypothetical protein Q9187_004316 [Circinaria calcarea]
MDHLPLPSSATTHLKVPCISTGKYDNGPFLSFPIRQGWEIPEWIQSIDQDVLHCGKTPTIQEIHDFLQTWLFFGSLCELFGNAVDLSNFVATDGYGGKFLCTLRIKHTFWDRFVECVDDTAPQDTQAVAMRGECDRIKTHLDNLYYALNTVKELADSATVTATALLGQSLENIITTLYRRVLKIETPVPIQWGFAFSGWIFDHMKNLGWCPSTITQLAMDNPDLCSLYYTSRLPPPYTVMGHSACTDDSCLALQIDPNNYHTKHTKAHCHCPELILDAQKIGKILRENRLPLVEICPYGEPANVKMTIRVDDGNVGFVAISHVWADGLGNIKDNSLPACSLQEVSRLVNELPRCSTQRDKLVPFWIDTVCVPVEPGDLKQLALKRLRDPYTRAEHVLVLDNYLRTVCAEGCDSLESLARLSCCNWIRRLWTLQEGRLAKRVWFQFRDKAIELKTLWNGLQRPSKEFIDYLPMVASIATRWTATNIFDADENNDNRPWGHPLGLVKLRYILCSRSVSVTADEALCLFCLAGWDMEKITCVPASAPLRMRVFWRQMQTVPSGLLFSKYSPKLDAPGLRWAPLSLMGVLPRHDWAGSPAVENNSDGIPTERGLLVSFPGFIYNINWHNLCNGYGFFFRSAGDWFTIYFDEPWHQAPASVTSQEPQRMAVILMKPLQVLASRNEPCASEEPKWPESSRGILGILTHDDTGIRYVKALRHIRVHVKDPLEQLINDAAFECISAGLWDGDCSLSLYERAMRTTETYFAEHPTVAMACQKWAAGSPYATGQDRFAARLVEMAEPTYYGGIAESLTEKQQWCAD